VLDLASTSDYSVSEMHNPFRLVIEVPANRTAKVHQQPDRKPAGVTNAGLPAPQPSQVKRDIPTPFESGHSTAKGPASQNVRTAVPETPLQVDQLEASAAKVPIETAPVQLPVEVVDRPAISSVAIQSSPVPGTGAAPVKRPDPPPLTPPMPVSDSVAPEKKPVLTRSTQSSPAAQDTLRPAPKAPLSSKVAANVPRPPAVSAPLPAPKPAAPTSSGDRTLTRMLGLKIGRIVIDPGHGGHDTGTIGKGGLREKDLVLDVALQLRSMLEEKLGAEVILTRDRDVFVSLEDRTAIANQRQADVFVSIHANSSSNRATSGVETYFLSFARTAAERDRDLQDLVAKIARADKSAESRELAAILQRQLYTGARRLFPSPRNRGVRSAPFIVLIGANMPSVPAEVAFISNPRDEKLLKKEDNKQRLAKALFSGIEGYMKALASDVAQSQSHSN
jgi:N-acetylmuramoyl-L-alanine amidase